MALYRFAFCTCINTRGLLLYLLFQLNFREKKEH
jgi:hypothetical protein